MDVPELENFQSRKQFNEWREKAESFTNRHNQHYQFVKNNFGVVANKVELNKITRDVKKAQKLAEQEIAKIEKLPFREGGTVGSRLAMFGERGNPSGISRPKDFNFRKIKTRRDLERVSERMHDKANPYYYDKRKSDMKDNFKEILHLSFGETNLVNEIIDMIDIINANDFYEIYQMDQHVFDFNLYDSEGQYVDADEGTLHKMKAYLDEYLDGTMNMDLKGF